LFSFFQAVNQDLEGRGSVSEDARLLAAKPKKKNEFAPSQI
jgi:hypothetical protein